MYMHSCQTTGEIWSADLKPVEAFNKKNVGENQPVIEVSI